jgi:hypothetical protein
VGAGAERQPLDGVQWADWDATGRLLVATTDGRLQVRAEPFGTDDTTWEIDVTDDRPSFFEPPSEARRWVP